MTLLWTSDRELFCVFRVCAKHFIVLPSIHEYKWVLAINLLGNFSKKKKKKIAGLAYIGEKSGLGSPNAAEDGVEYRPGCICLCFCFIFHVDLRIAVRSLSLFFKTTLLDFFLFLFVCLHVFFSFFFSLQIRLAKNFMTGFCKWHLAIAIERLQIECRKTKTGVITIASYKRHRQSNEILKTQCNYTVSIADAQSGKTCASEWLLVMKVLLLFSWKSGAGF